MSDFLDAIRPIVVILAILVATISSYFSWTLFLKGDTGRACYYMLIVILMIISLPNILR